MAWRRPEAPQTPEEREAAYRRSLEMQAELYGVPADGIASPRRQGRREREDDEFGEVTMGLLEFIDVHPVITVIILPLLPILAIVWLVQRIRR